MTATFHRMVQFLTYPLVMVSGISLHLVLIEQEINLVWTTYIPILASALIITIMEQHFPHREEWSGAREDYLQDGLFMLLVQVALPRLLSSLVLLTGLDWFYSSQSATSNLWPHEWSVEIQVVLMLLTADFLRYWLHRASHEWPPLWQLHAVHHSPHKLYWFNVGRFHPLEKCLQISFDTLPFILVGVKKEMIALYLVFYSINGFFQHCNIQLALGPLNYLISGPELHRWHHSKLVKESNQNYGNNLIVWDLAFGTWFLPEMRQVGKLGLMNPDYPISFLDQMTTPFKKGLDKQ